MLKNKKGLFITFLGFLFLSISAQNTDSPYSRYGYGILKDNAIGASRSMGGISYGLRSGQNVNPGNPASYSQVDSLTFIFDIGINYTNTKLSDSKNSQREHNGGLDYIAMQMLLSKKLGFSFGILPYSYVGYKFGSQETAENTSYVKSFSGTGGISQFYGGLAYSPLKNVSVGANAYYMFGSIDHSRNITDIGASSAYTKHQYKKIRVSSVRFDVGLQYSHTLNKENILTVGAVYSPKMEPKARFTRINQDISEGTSLVAADTLSSNVYTGTPSTYGLGFSLAHKKNLIVGADVTLQQWSDVKYSNETNDMDDGMDPSNRFNDRWKINLGAEYTIDPTARNYFQRMKFRGGFNYSNSYLNVKNTEGVIGGFKEYGATLGFGFPFRDSYTGRTSYINLGFEYLTVRPEVSNMIKETYLGVTLNVNINDLWFMKSKFK